MPLAYLIYRLGRARTAFPQSSLRVPAESPQILCRRSYSVGHNRGSIFHETGYERRKVDDCQTNRGPFPLTAFPKGTRYVHTAVHPAPLSPLQALVALLAFAATSAHGGEWMLYLDGVEAGYFPESEWSGAFTAASVTQVYGEAWQDGTYYPSLNGTVSGYASSGGGHLSTLAVDSPYVQSNASQTGFTASGGPGPASTTAGYLYVADEDTTLTTSASVNLPINAQTIGNAPEHSLFEMAMINPVGTWPGDTIEIGITTDLSLNGDTNPHWFVFSWINGTPQGYDANSDFVSQTGTFWTTPLTSLEGTAQNVAFVYSTVPTPEPSTVALLAVGAISLLAYAWRPRRKAGF